MIQCLIFLKIVFDKPGDLKIVLLYLNYEAVPSWLYSGEAHSKFNSISLIIIVSEQNLNLINVQKYLQGYPITQNFKIEDDFEVREVKRSVHRGIMYHCLLKNRWIEGELRQSFKNEMTFTDDICHALDCKWGSESRNTFFKKAID